MPIDFSFIQVFDFYFKAHKVLNLNFEPEIENAMIFMQAFIYRFDDGQKKTTQAMKELVHSLNIHDNNNRTSAA